MQFPHHLKVTRGGSGGAEGSLDPDTGIWTPAESPAADLVLYDGAADVQDPGTMIRRTQEYIPVMNASSDLTAFLYDERAIRKIKNNDQAEVTWEDGSVETFTVVRSHHIDGSITLRGGEAT